MGSGNPGSILSDLDDDTSLEDRSILETMGPIPEFEFDAFISHVFSEIPSHHIKFPTREALIEKGIYTAEDRWTLFEKCPSESKIDEKDYFANLNVLFLDIAGLVKMRARYHKPETSVEPEVGFACKNIEPSGYKDAYTTCHVKFKAPRCHVACEYLDVAVLGHVSLQDNAENRTNNYLNTLKSYRNLMRKNFSRRFVYAYTVEDKKMRIWHFSRIGVMVCKPFDWFSESERLVRIFSLLAVAIPRQLGLSPVITPVRIGDNIRYEFALKSGIYVTTGTVLADPRAQRLFGIATRVIVVKKKGVEDAPEMALKYYWTPEGKKPLEGDKLNKLRCLAKEQGMDPDKFLLKPVDHGVFEWWNMVDSVDGRAKVQDTSKRFIDGDLSKPPHFLLYRSKRESFKSIDSADINTVFLKDYKDIYDGIRGPFFIPPAFEPFKYKLQHRKQVYVLYEEVGIALHDITYLPNMFLALRDAVKALYCLHQLGFVHQDISTGNFMIYKGTTKILDLEYVFPIYQDPLYELSEQKALFTLQFVSDDVLSKEYSFRPTIGKDLITYPVEEHNKMSSCLKWPHFDVAKPRDGTSTKLNNYIAYLKMNNVESPKSGQPGLEDEGEVEAKSGNELRAETFPEARKLLRIRTEKQVPLDFLYNAAYDLESCNWILLWIFYQHIPEDGACDYKYSTGHYTQLKEAQAIFPDHGKTLSGLRVLMLHEPYTINQKWHKCLPTVYSSALKTVQAAFIAVKSMHEEMQQYNPVLPEPRFHFYSSLIRIYNHLATMPELQFRIKYLSNYWGKLESPLEMEYCPKVEPDDFEEEGLGGH